jgi:hypothetical protein
LFLAEFSVSSSMAPLFLPYAGREQSASLPYAPPPKWMIAPQQERERSMLDLALLVSGVGFFALSIAYAFACDRL